MIYIHKNTQHKFFIALTPPFEL